MKISICITVKNRSRVEVEGGELFLFPKCIRSIVDAVSSTIPCELIVTDWGSDDWPLKKWLEKAAYPIPVKIISLEGPFSRGLGLNRAAEAAQSEFLLFSDTDLLLSEEVIATGIKHLSEGRAYFPVLYYFNDTSHTDGWWNHYSYGNCFVTRKMFYEANKWPEYKSWGKEDDHFYENIVKRTEVVRDEVPGFCHQWHPDDLIWKNRFAESASEIAHEIQQVEIAKQEITQIVPGGEKFILVDEARFGGRDCIKGRKNFQFPEFNGEYGGPPVDSETAIEEFESLLKESPNYIAFAWMAFWWLEYYKLFKEYLDDRFSCVLNNERLVVYDLQRSKQKKGVLSPQFELSE